MNSATARSIPLLASVPRRQRRKVTSWADELDVPAGETVVREGEYAREFFVIVEGHAAVIRDGERVATLGPGDFFGELGLLEGPARTASVTALSDLRLVVAGAREFATMLHAAPALGDEIRRVAAGRRPQRG